MHKTDGSGRECQSPMLAGARKRRPICRARRMASKKGTLGPWTRMEASNLVGVEARFRRAVRARVSGRTVGTGTQGRLQVPSNSAPPRARTIGGLRVGRSWCCSVDEWCRLRGPAHARDWGSRRRRRCRLSVRLTSSRLWGPCIAALCTN
jgi:hypothetical protein